MRNRDCGHPEPGKIHRTARPGQRLAALVTAATLLAVGCASSPPVDYYQLQALETRSAAPLPDAQVIAVGPVTLPEYLARSQMVTRGKGTQLTVDDFNRWAEPLDKAVPRVLVLNMTELVPGVVTVRFTDRVVTPSQRLFATISRFDADDQGSAVLIAQWGINSADGAPLLPPRTSRYEAQAVPAASPEAEAAALSRLLEDFSRDLAAAVQQIIDAQGLASREAGRQDDHSEGR